MRVGWLHDDPGYIGGAELTQAEFRAAAPEGVEVVSVPPEGLELLADCERAVVFNCVHYPPETARALVGKHVTRYFNDVDPDSSPELRDALLASASCVFTSPLHRDRFPWSVPDETHLIPPALDLQSFRPNRQTRRNTEREGTCSIAAWRAPSKGGQLLLEWAKDNGEVDVYGEGHYLPHGYNLNVKGPLEPIAVAQTLHRYERFVFLPNAVEPFGRAVVEAWAAGCELVTNCLVGALHWIQKDPEALETAASDFWRVALDEWGRVGDPKPLEPRPACDWTRRAVPVIAVICPTIPGREESLARTIESYRGYLPVHVYPDSPSSGEGWQAGLEEYVAVHGQPDYVHFTNDDCELIGSLEPAIEACRLGFLPAPIVRNPNGFVQSAGGDMSAPDNLLKDVGADWAPVGFTTVPFMSWEQWTQIGMLNVHYSSDVWVSHRGRQLGIETVLRHGYEFTHHNHPVGRGAGMSQGQRAGQDQRVMERALADSA